MTRTTQRFPRNFQKPLDKRRKAVVRYAAMTITLTSGAMRRSEQALHGSSAYACLPVVGSWLNQIPTFDTEKPLG